MATPRGRISGSLVVLILMVGARGRCQRRHLRVGGADHHHHVDDHHDHRTSPPPPAPVYPLTGMPVLDPAVAARPTLIVKIDNSEPDARPQIGLNQADVVYEERVAGAVTRFMALFHSNDAIPVGPVRSARTSDIGLFKPMGTPLFAWSGANAVTGGQAFAARWVKPALEAPTQYVDMAGAPIRLTPGRTWVALPEPGTTTFLP